MGLCDDYVNMSCETVRESISAVLDGEQPCIGIAAQELHLTECPPCRAWQEAAHEVTRRMRLAPAPLVATESAPPPRMVEVVMARSAAPLLPAGPLLPRIGLVVAAVLQVGVISEFFDTDHAHGLTGHVSHELASFGLALALAFLIAAWRPVRAAGIGSAVGAIALLLVITAVLDISGGHASPLDESMHLLAVMGWLLLRWLAAVTPPGFGSPDRARWARVRLAWRALRSSSVGTFGEQPAFGESSAWSTATGPAAQEGQPGQRPEHRGVA
jgi:predicted anti-sigma-YlaC factor YlaD